MAKQRSPKAREAGQRVVGERWESGAQATFLGLREWRALHPRATLQEIEAELDQQLERLRAQMLQDLALASAARTARGEERAVCPECGGALHDAGEHHRTLWTVGQQAVRLDRHYGTCPACGSRVFPPG